MDSEKPYITKRPHKKSRNGCSQCKQRKQKCDEVQPACGSCKKRKVQCHYAPRPTPGTFRSASEALGTIQDSEENSKQLVLRKSTSSSSQDDSESESLIQNAYGENKTAESVTSEEEVPRDIKHLTKQRLGSISIPEFIQPVPWRNSLEHSLYDSFYNTHRESLEKPGMEDATREIWLNLVPQIALTRDRTLFKLLLSLGSMHLSIKSSDYPYIQPGTPGAKMWNMSNFYFSEAISSFRQSITSKKIYETNPEVFCVIALVLSFRSSMNANYYHTDVYSLYDDMLSWFTSTLGYIALGGFYTKKLRHTRLGEIMKANPGATYHFYPFLEYIRTQEFAFFYYLHPMGDPVSGTLDPEDSSDEALNAYTLSLKLIGWVYQAAIDGAPISDLYGMFQTVPYTVPNYFLDMLRQKRPRAIAVLAHHIALTAFFGVYERMHFWPREHILLLQGLVPLNWLWAFDKALEVVDRAKHIRSSDRTIILPAQRRAPALLDAVG